MRKYNFSILEKENSQSYYLLGAFIADGDIRLSNGRFESRISSCDIDWLITINKLFSSENLLKTITKNSVCKRLEIYNKNITLWFNNHGCFQHKSLTVNFPKIPTQYLADFIRGCMDGDGNLCFYKTHIDSKNKKYLTQRASCYLCSASKNFIDSISNILNKLNYKHSVITIKPSSNNKIVSKNNIYRIKFNDKNAAKFLQWIYYPNHNLSMNRKNLLAQTIINYYK
jgi:intein/homing endonuclease